MNKITPLFTMLSIGMFAQQQFPGENENNAILNAGFEQAPTWKDCNECENDNFGWEGYLVEHREDKSEVYIGTDNKVSVPSADGDYYALAREFDASIYQVFEVEPNTQYTVKYKFGWINFMGRSIELLKNNGECCKEINAVITNNLTGSEKVILKKFSHIDNSLYTLGSTDNTFATAFFDSWNDVEWTFTTGDQIEVRLAFWKMAGTPPYILDNVEVFPTPETAVSKFGNVQFSLSPNPTNNVLNLKASKQIAQIVIINVMGQTTLTKTINALESVIDVSNLNKGVYMINVNIEGNTQSYKFLKK